jgi:NADPH:quinone reductase-like Zn-dependent oxidoreductase
LTLIREELPTVSPRELLVRVLATALNFRDLPFVRGNASRKPNRGRIPLTDAVGVVELIGEEVNRFHVGERVSPIILPNWQDGPLHAHAFKGSLGSDQRDGVLSEFIVIEQDAVVKVPAYLSDIQAASVPTAALTAWHAAVEIGVLQPSSTVVIETTGGVAMFAAPFCAALGHKVILTSRSTDKLERARSMEVWKTINTVECPEWDKKVLEWTDGRGADLVIDMGLENGLPRSCRAAAFEGTVAIVGVVAGWTTSFDIAPVMNKNLRVRGVETGSRAMFERLNAFLIKHQITPVIDSVYKFDDVEVALTALGNGPVGKIVIDLT